MSAEMNEGELPEGAEGEAPATFGMVFSRLNSRGGGALMMSTCPVRR